MHHFINMYFKITIKLMKKGKIMLAGISTLILCLVSLSIKAQERKVSVSIDGSEKIQQIDGFGVNINTVWWFNGDYRDVLAVRPAIDILIDSLGATIFRAVIEEMDWEKVNDNDSPDTFNWNYYKKVFSDKRFDGVWNTLRYLNKKGITDGLIISLMGSPPSASPLTEKEKHSSWMGDTDYSISPSKEDEFAESVVALLYYARHTAKIQFKLVSPVNETDIISSTISKEHPDGIVEGPNIPDAAQVIRILKKIALKLDSTGMNDIRFIFPDAGGEKLFAACFEEMNEDTYLMGKLHRWGVHDYGSDAKNYHSIVNIPENPNKSYWVTEMAGFGNLLGQLKDGAGSYIFWDGFDCVYQHAIRNGYGSNPPNDWVFWYGPGEGKPMIEYIPSSNQWKPRKQFYEFGQVYKYVKPHAVQIVSENNDTSLIVRTFLNPDGKLVITGRNLNSKSILLNVTVNNLPLIKSIEMIYTNKDLNLKRSTGIILNKSEIKATVPADCVFTLIGS